MDFVVKVKVYKKVYIKGSNQYKGQGQVHEHHGQGQSIGKG